jgi:hypothetical protein
MSTPTTPTKTPIVRAWTSIAPKLLAWLAGSLSATIIIQVCAAFGYSIEPGLAAVIATVVGTVAGYFKTDSVIVGKHEL